MSFLFRLMLAAIFSTAALSTPALAKKKGAKGACYNDAAKFCGDTKIANSSAACIVSNFDKLSPACRASVEERQGKPKQ